jgi:hypothetical protein
MASPVKDNTLTDQRQRARSNGRYAQMDPCPRCSKRRALGAAYSVSDGGSVKDSSPYAGGMICGPCVKAES